MKGDILSKIDLELHLLNLLVSYIDGLVSVLNIIIVHVLSSCVGLPLTSIADFNEHLLEFYLGGGDHDDITGRSQVAKMHLYLVLRIFYQSNRRKALYR